MGETKLMPDNTAAAILANARVINFKTLGLVLGGAEAFPLNVGGYVTLGLALGAMKGQNDVSTINTTVTTTFKTDSVSGYSYGVGYFYTVTPGVIFSIDYKGQLYVYTFDSGLPSEYEFREKLSGFGVTLSVKF